MAFVDCYQERYYRTIRGITRNLKANFFIKRLVDRSIRELTFLLLGP